MAILARSRVLAAAIVLAVLAAAAVECRHALRPTEVDALGLGAWGGMHLNMTVRADGAQMEFDCGTATVDGAIALDAKGAFDVRGKYSADGAGPTLPGQTTRPIRFTGSASREELTMRAVLTDDDVDLGLFTLGFGQRARLFKCR